MNYRTLENIYQALDELLFLPDIYSRKYRYEKLHNQYPDTLDKIVSYTFELNKLNVTPIYNDFTNFDYSIDFGNLVYCNMNDEDYQTTFTQLPYPIQKLIYIILNKTLINKLGEDYLLIKMDKYYKLSELLLDLQMPDIIDKVSVGIQGLKRDKIKTIEFPIYLYQIPNKLSYDRLQYFIKKDGEYVSNINSGVIREYIKNNIMEANYGVIGITTKIRGFKRKYKFIPLYFNLNSNNVKLLYQNKGAEYSNDLDSLNLDNIPKLITLNNEDELKNFISKKKKKVTYIVLSNNGVEVMKPNIEYKNVKILDYIYNDYYEAKGLVVEFQGRNYEIYFNVMETHYIDSIEDKYVRISVVNYKGVVLSVYYNSELKLWSRVNKVCKVCGKVDSKHNRDGVCNSCIYKFERYVEIVNRECIVDCVSEFETTVGNYSFKSVGGKLVVSCIGVCQQNLDLFKGKLCESI